MKPDPFASGLGDIEEFGVAWFEESTPVLRGEE
jgi:hypothetical protein